MAGAGPTGLTLAVELARRGIDHLLVDAGTTSTPYGRVNTPSASTACVAVLRKITAEPLTC
ncbi:FAD-dependent monooxygenase [Nonomuraea sp. H19]|uniref:FAD-dependent monooxygenase n=1 Tax=Nonomuraea sp. H19 TaxID=3452206 RepID=UPI003F89C8D3